MTTLLAPARKVKVRPEPILRNGTAYATLSIPDPKGKGPAKVYRVYPERMPDGRRIPGRVKLWRRAEDGTTTTYRVYRDEDGKTFCNCKAGGYGLPCKHKTTADRLGIV